MVTTLNIFSSVSFLLSRIIMLIAAAIQIISACLAVGYGALYFMLTAGIIMIFQAFLIGIMMFIVASVKGIIMLIIAFLTGLYMFIKAPFCAAQTISDFLDLVLNDTQLVMLCPTMFILGLISIALRLGGCWVLQEMYLVGVSNIFDSSHFTYEYGPELGTYMLLNLCICVSILCTLIQQLLRCYLAFSSQGGHLAKIPHQAQRNYHVLGVNLELSALQSDI